MELHILPTPLVGDQSKSDHSTNLTSEHIEDISYCTYIAQEMKPHENEMVKIQTTLITSLSTSFS